ncbi:MAG TPA: EfeM/EfeO family lipoprotein [Polyangiales bacterium]|nr:EfeM/EfeO family lipoprotein [Polyangiales bacterium]
MKRTRLHACLCLAALSCAFVACKNDDADDPQTDAILDTKSYVEGELQKLVAASQAMQAAAPTPDDDGWNSKDDKAAVDKMRAAWSDSRDAYEHIEGSIAVLFSGLDVSTDERYDGFIEGEPDDDLFDDEGVTGMHAIERILWAGEHPKAVVDFEKALPGYKEAAFPKTKAEATAFKTKLAKKLVDDVKQMHDEFEPFALAPSTAFWGMIGSMNEQLEKVTLAATAEDESRYAQRTLDDMRANLEGAEQVYAAFRTWVIDATGKDVDDKVQKGFESIRKAYAAHKGAAIPAPPDGFDPDKPSDADLATPYGKLYELLVGETDIKAKGSLISLMSSAADDMGIEELEE